MMASKENIEASVEDREFTEEENRNLLRAYEGDLLKGLVAAAGYKNDEHKKIQIIRDNTLYFEFTIRPLGEDEYEKCKRQHTKYVRNKQFGVKLPEETNRVNYRCALIYEATIPADREKLWDNKQVWKALNDKGGQIVTGINVIEHVLKGGEKDKIIETIDTISGYDDNSVEEIVKN